MADNSRTTLLWIMLIRQGVSSYWYNVSPFLASDYLFSIYFFKEEKHATFILHYQESFAKTV